MLVSIPEIIVTIQLTKQNPDKIIEFEISYYTFQAAPGTFWLIGINFKSSFPSHRENDCRMAISSEDKAEVFAIQF